MDAYLRIFFAQIQEKSWPRIQQILELRETFKNSFSLNPYLGGGQAPPQIDLWQGCIMDAYLRIFFAQIQEKSWPRIHGCILETAFLFAEFNGQFFLNST